ncbi:RNA polymerase sigma factor SigL [Stieleria neptunia]|uniref:RNA polymerase sigma factor SigL n=1 Tax=Stieleria neptunia TaxID=2527979 RepID=A0A518HU36_9BACT|nr:sigma-70 family RNA polymerase sigma factor [Stieleria neptunia]QDV44317.1 RNA polymerase sigma factor SigL [Stieleria neptunia]
MSDVTEILDRIESGDPDAGDQLLPLVYDELRQLARGLLAHESAGQTLQPTALVHEAYLRLLGGEADARWNSRGHFFGAAARAIRRILVDNARRKNSIKHGGGSRREELVEMARPDRPQELLAIDEALVKLSNENRQAAAFVEMRYFAGFSLTETAEALGISPRAASRIWTYARAWLYRELHPDQAEL